VEGLLKSEVAAEQESEETVEQAVAAEGAGDQQRHLDRDIGTHRGGAPEADGEAVEREAERGDEGGATNGGPARLFEGLGFGAEEVAHRIEVIEDPSDEGMMNGG